MGQDGSERVASKSQVTVKTVAVVCFTALGIVALAKMVMGATYALGILIGATLVAIALHHGVDFLQKHKFRRRPAILTTLAVFFGLLGLLFMLILPPALKQARDLINDGPELVQKARHTELYQKVNERLPLDQGLEGLRKKSSQEPETMVQPALHFVGSVFKILGAVTAILATSIIVLLFGGAFVKRALAESLPTTRERYERVLHKIYESVGGYLTGLGMICGANAAATTTFLLLMRVPFFLPLGLLSGLSSLVPFVGNVLMGVVISAVALVAGGVNKAIACAVFFIVYQQVENHILSPLIYRRTVDVNPFVNVAVLLVFSEVAGIPGAILAVPAIAALQIVLREVLRYRREQIDAPQTGPLSHPVPKRKLELDDSKPLDA